MHLRLSQTYKSAIFQAYVNRQTTAGIGWVRIILFAYFYLILFTMRDQIDGWAALVSLNAVFGVHGAIVLLLLRSVSPRLLMWVGGLIDQVLLLAAFLLLANNNLPGEVGSSLMFMILIFDMPLVIINLGVIAGLGVAIGMSLLYLVVYLGSGTTDNISLRVFQVLTATGTAGITAWIVFSLRVEVGRRAEEIESRTLVEAEKRRLARENHVLAEIGRTITSSLDISEVYSHFGQLVDELIRADRIDVVTIDFEPETLTVEYAYGREIDAPSAQVGFTRPLDGSIAEQVLIRRSPILSVPQGADQLQDEFPARIPSYRLGFLSAISMPLVHQGEVIGMLALMSTKHAAYSEGDVRLAERIADQISGAIANSLESEQRRQAEQEVRISEARYETLIENVDARVSLKNPDGTYVIINQALAGAYGRPKEAFIGRKLGEVISDERERISATRDAEVMSSKRPYEVEENDGEATFVTRKAPVIDDDGSVINIASISTDITERKLAEATVRKAEEKYRAIVENSDDPIIVIQDGEVVYRNPSDVRLVGKLASESVEKRFIDFIAPEDRDRVRTYYQARLRGEPAPDRYEVTRIVDEGRRMRVEVKPRIIDFDGRPATMVIQRDLTDRVNAEEELRSLRRRLLTAQEEERRHIAQELHDEIGQELTGLKFFLASTRNKPRLQAERTVSEVTANLDSLLDTVRDLSLNLRPSMLDDLGLLPALVWLVDRNLTRGGLHVDFNHSGLNGRFDPEIDLATYRVIQEGLTNVQRHAKTTEAKLSVIVSEDSISITVEDQGCGSQPDDLHRIASTGLPGIRERVELLGGTFQFNSSPGNGTTLHASLPCASNHDSAD